MNEIDFALQLIGVVVRLAMHHDDFAIGGAILQYGNKNAIKLSSAAQARDDDRKPRHETFLVTQP